MGGLYALDFTDSARAGKPPMTPARLFQRADSGPRRARRPIVRVGLPFGQVVTQHQLPPNHGDEMTQHLRTTWGALAFVAAISAFYTHAGGEQLHSQVVAPGLIGRYFCQEARSEPACVRIDPAIAFDWSDGMPDDHLPSGDFRVVWEGLLRVQHPGTYRFTAPATGNVEIHLQGRQVYPSKHGKAAAPIPLIWGDYPIRVVYAAPAGQAKVHLVWSSDSFPPEVVNPRYLAHEARAETPVAAQLARQRGREIVQRYACARCHSISGVDRSRRPGLGMPHVAEMNPEWVARWLRDPQALRPGTRMGAPGGSPEEINVLIANLLALVEHPEVRERIDPKWHCAGQTDPLDQGDIGELARAGRRRFYELGCSACHAPETPELVDPTRGPSMADLGSKWSKTYLRKLMIDPVGRHPTGGMPGYELQEDDLDQLVAYMSTFTLPAPAERDAADPLVPPPVKLELLPGQSLLDPKVLPEIKAPFLDRACYACHSPESMLFEGPPLDPSTARWDSGCLRSDRTASRAPCFTLTPADRKAVIAFLAHRPEEPSAPASGELARQMIEETLYCVACHRRDGTGGEGLARTLLPYLGTDPQAKAAAMTPPDLSGVGARLVRPWILNALAGEAESNRPWLTVPMPIFGLSEAERSRIADRLAVADQIPDLGTPPVKIAAEESSSTARVLIGQRGFNCVNCHFLGAADYRPDKTAPDFTMAPRRVSRDWFHRWVSNPGRIMPGTPMPTFTRPVNAPADGDVARQKEIIWRFLNHVSVAEEATTP